ncbi:MAG: malto-oligosyltrehalose synthase [Acidobacteria bacterium]|nr:malto-oligosyltrehalose synthase [Acidobacteriota bacterium]
MRRLPTSTYRLQLHAGFTLHDAAALVPYLDALGVTDCYLSPVMTARPGSQHGYDVVDHTQINPELGGDEAYAAFMGAVAAHRMGVVLDFVPNHMSIDPRTNPRWRDVLENGPSSRYAHFFDIDWDPIKTELENKVLLPILSDQYGWTLERGDLRLGFGEGTLHLDYEGMRLPINPRQATLVFRHGLEALQAELGEEHPDLAEFLSILTALQNMPAYTERDPERIRERSREKEIARERMLRLVERSAPIARHVERAIVVFNGEPGRPESFDLLHELLERQAYRLAYWRTAGHEINYRRFFDINDLAGLRMEDPEVFAATHELVARLLADPHVTGLRIDHPDGLFDPLAYCQNVQKLAGGDVYLVAEKILSEAESLPPEWPIHGTTGYNFLSDLNGLFVNPASAPGLRRFYTRITRRVSSFADEVYESKQLIMETSMASELNVLADELNRISEGNRRYRDFTLNSLREALREVVACFPVYRTYVDARGWTEADRERIEVAIRRARRRNPAVESSIFDFLREVLLPRDPSQAPAAEPDRRSPPHGASEDEYRRRLNFSLKLQQYTGPVQAKGQEDTAFYRHNVLVSLNEVGGEPSRLGRTLQEFHHANAVRAQHWPYEMLATSTHDTKLGEDVRARINVLSEIPEVWRREVGRWMRINSGHRTTIESEPAPNRNDEYRFYQALVGAWPAELTQRYGSGAAGTVSAEFVERIQAYMNKAIKEAKTETSWISPNKPYDEAMHAFIARTLTGPTSRRFLAAFLPFQARIAQLGAVNSLAQVVLKIAAPGVPDIFQGSERWNLRLVDPDNRQRPDHARSRDLLRQIGRWIEVDLDNLDLPPEGGSHEDTDHSEDPDRLAATADMLAHWPDGRIKLFVTACCLTARRRAGDRFARAEYLPLDTETADTAPAGIVSFARRYDGTVALVAAPRFCAVLSDFAQEGAPGPGHGGRAFPLGPEVWRGARILLPRDWSGLRFINVFTREAVQPVHYREEWSLMVGDVLKSCPVAWLVARQTL